MVRRNWCIQKVHEVLGPPDYRREQFDESIDSKSGRNCGRAEWDAVVVESVADAQTIERVQQRRTGRYISISSLG